MARLMVTGGTGFLGTPAVAIALERGFEVHVLARTVPGDRPRGAAYHAVDLLDDRDRMRRLVREIAPSHCLHLAWYAEPKRFWTSRANARWVSATVDLAEAFADAGGTRIIGAGSCAEYDWADGFCREDTTPLQPATLYGVAKDATRRLLESWSVPAGVSVAWGRVFFVYGPGEHPDKLVASVILALIAGRRAACSEGSQQLDLLHVRDAADALVTLAGSGYAGAVNIASGQPVAVRGIVQRIAAAMGRPDLLDFGAVPASGVPPMIAADVRRLREALQWAPRMDLDSGLRDAIRWHAARAAIPGVRE